MGYKFTAKKQLSTWRYEQNGTRKYIEAGETFVQESNNLNGYNLCKAVEKAKGCKMKSSISSSPSENDWIIEKF